MTEFFGSGPGVQTYGAAELSNLERVLKQKSPFRFDIAAKSVSFSSRFEKEWGCFIGAATNLLVSSGTAAIYLALQLVSSLRPKKKVLLVPAYGWTADVHPAVMLGYEIKICPVTPSLHLDLNAARDLCSSDVAAMVLIHMRGLATDGLEYRKFCQQRDIILIEDISQAINARASNGYLVGTGGDIVVSSFQANKYLSAGEGGIISIRRADTDSRDLVSCLHDLGQNRAFDISSGRRIAGLNFRISEFQSAVLCAQIEKLSLIERGLKCTYEKAIKNYGEYFTSIGLSPVNELYGSNYSYLVLSGKSNGRNVLEDLKTNVSEYFESSGQKDGHHFKSWIATLPNIRDPNGSLLDSAKILDNTYYVPLSVDDSRASLID